MSLLTASQECESIARKFYKLSFLEGGGCYGEHKSCKYLSFWNLLSHAMLLLELSTVTLWNTLEHSTE